MAKHILVQAREQIDGHHVGVESVVRYEGLLFGDFVEHVAVELYAQSYLGELGVV